MDVILLEKVENLGALGDVVRVRPGYARNFLVPRGKAKFATAENLAEFEARRAELEKVAAEHLAAAEARKAKLEGVEVTVTAKAGGEGKLFGSVTNGDVVRALEEQGLEIERKEVRMPEGPIRSAGEYQIELHLHSDVNATIKLQVVAEE
jgi:large subunit ribosomal protein L9